MSLGVKLPPTVRGERPVSYEICALFTYRICYWEAYRHFFGEGSVVLWMDFFREDVPWGGKFMGGGEDDYSSGNVTLMGFD